MSNCADTIINEVATIEVIISEGSQGPQGPQGPPGVAGALQLTTPIVVGGNRVIMADFNYADSSDIATAGLAVAVTQNAANIGDLVTLVSVGPIPGFAGLITNDPVYLNVNGTVTQVVPTSGYIQKVGIALSATEVYVNLSEPLILQ